VALCSQGLLLLELLWLPQEQLLQLLLTATCPCSSLQLPEEKAPYLGLLAA
jgi:hypothetical protein